MAAIDKKNLKKQKKAEKKAKKLEKKKNRSKFNKAVRKILACLLIVFLCAVLFGVYRISSIAIKYQKQAKQIVRDAGEQVFKENQTSIIYDCNGDKITSLIGARDSYYLEYTEIPYFVKRAMITTEDRKFYSHQGVDFKAVSRAVIELIKNDGEITQGGSTITQQLAKNIFLTNEVSFERKFKEMFIAFELENRYSKDKILEFYINNIYFANGYYGIQAAAKGYFNKPVTDLSISQMAYICSIPNNPSLYDPYIHGENTISRRNRILKQMYEQGDIDREMYETAVNEDIIIVSSENTTNNYVETYVRHCATETLMRYYGFEFENKFDSVEARADYDERYNAVYDELSAKLYTGGYRIYTSIDMGKQELLQKTIDENLSYYSEVNEEGIYKFQGAATCIDNNTGKVVAIVGGRSQEYNGYTLNRAYQSFRQPGSSIKPILDYTPAFQNGMDANTIVEDKEIENGPVNSPDIYEGKMTIRNAVEKSKNTIAWEIFDKLSADYCLEFLLNMNFNKIVPSDYVLPASIGGLTYGVSTEEMAAAYSCLENEGVFRTATCINKITDSDYMVLVDNISTETERTAPATVEAKQIYDSTATKMMTDVLMGVLTRGTGKNYNVGNAVCAAKTGTTNGNKDVWLVGYSAYYTTAVWCGYDIPKEINDGYGTTCSGNIWNQYMTWIHEGLEPIDFYSYEQQEKPETSQDETTTQEGDSSSGEGEGGSESGQEGQTTTIGEGQTVESGLYTDPDGQNQNKPDESGRITEKPDSSDNEDDKKTENDKNEKGDETDKNDGLKSTEKTQNEDKRETTEKPNSSHNGNNKETTKDKNEQGIDDGGGGSGAKPSATKQQGESSGIEENTQPNNSENVTRQDIKPKEEHNDNDGNNSENDNHNDYNNGYNNNNQNDNDFNNDYDNGYYGNDNYGYDGGNGDGLYHEAW